MEPPKPGMKRISVRPKHPNPLFEQWLEEWRKEAADKGSDMQYCFGRAMKSLQKYPLRLRSGKECMILECFGNRLCQLLDRKLSEYRKTHPEIDDQPEENFLAQFSAPEPPKKKNSPKKKRVQHLSDEVDDSVEPIPKMARTSKGRKYIPAWRSGPYAILLTLFEEEKKPNHKGYMLKAELQKCAQPLSDKSFTKADPGSHYTAWSSMSQLVKKELVKKCSNPAKFSLTDEGRALAVLLKETNAEENKDFLFPTRQSPEREHQIHDNIPKDRLQFKRPAREAVASVNAWEMTSLGRAVSPSPQSSSKQYSQSPTKAKCAQKGTSSCDNNGLGTPVVLDRGLFDVLLLVDTCETGGATKKNHNQTISELTQMKVPFEVRKLEVGDFLWIARSQVSPNDELVLPYIVERKRMDDFGGSIKDGRFKEQKFRLKQSGIQNLIYLVESHGSDQHVGLPLSTLQQAAINTQVVDGFIVKHTADHRQSMAYLASLTRILGRSFLKKTLLGCQRKDLAEYTMSDDFITLINYKEFKQCTKKNKNFTVREMFIRQLVQMKGLSVEKATAIGELYPTPKALIQAYRFGGGENMLADIPCRGTATSRCVGTSISKAVHFIYNSRKLL